MNGEQDSVTVYKSTDMNAEQDASSVRNLLIKSGIQADLHDDNTPGIPDGTFEVRVARQDAGNAESLVAGLSATEGAQVDPSHALDMVTIAELEGGTGELEALAIQSILDASGINAVLVGSSSLPSLRFNVQVPREDVDRARAAIEEATAAGPAAAEAGAAATDPPADA